MSDLLNKKCVPCEGGILPFDISEIHKYQKKVDGWDVKKDEKKMIKLILNHLSKKYKIKILLKPDVKKSDYLNYSGINSKYVFENRGKPYKFIDESELVITFNNGTMGHESISRGVKNIQIPRPKLSKSKKFNIYNGTLEDKKIIFFLSSIFKMSIKTYFKKMNKFYEEIIYFNENNILLKKNLKNLIIKN